MDSIVHGQDQGGMRHRFHSICPYFAMFPETFVEKHLAASKFDGVVFDPFCGRGTTIFESLIRERRSAGCDVHPVAYCVAGAKSDPPTRTEVLERLSMLARESCSFRPADDVEDLAEFFRLCFAPSTYRQVRFLRERLDWRKDRTDRFISALCLGALHGESHRSPNYFSNRMPRTISTKPAYSVRWWRERGYDPPARDVFSILRRMNDYRFRSMPPDGRGEVALTDARDAARSFPHLVGCVTDVITSPPYIDTTNYCEDQWLRLWFLGGEATVRQLGGDGRHYNVEKYKAFLAESWAGIAPLLAPEARIVVRIGGRKLPIDEARECLRHSLEEGIKRYVHLMDAGVSSPISRSQANSFRGSSASPTVEHDFCFLLDERPAQPRALARPRKQVRNRAHPKRPSNGLPVPTSP